MSSTVTPNLNTVSLYYKEGTSNKEYHVQLTGSDEAGWMVNFQYGRVGSKLTTGTKTRVPVDFTTAKKIMDGLVHEKMAKGYTTGESGTPYQNTENAGKVSGLLPQLLNFIDEDEVKGYIENDAWVMQEKKDGVRCMIKKRKKAVEGANKKGLVTSLPKTTEDAIRYACGEADATLDGELVGEVFWLFDVLSMGIHAYSDKSYKERLEAIQEWFDPTSYGEHFRFVPTAVGKSSKKALYARLKKENAEGFVFKRLDAVYKPGRPASGGTQVKFKFYATATVRVKAQNDKRSVQMEVLERGDWVFVGNCTIPADQEIPAPGQYIEVRYLYAYPNGSLFQPTCLGVRTDVNEDDCLKSQLKYKQGSTKDDEA